MSCLINNINNINVLNTCGFNMGGLNQIWVANYQEGLYNSLTINNLGEITNIGTGIVFQELKFAKTGTKWSEIYNYSTKKYEQTLDLELVGYDGDKRLAIDSLIKAPLVFILKDNNGNYYLYGGKSAIYSNNYSATTDVNTGKSIYSLRFLLKSDTSLIPMVDSLITGLTQIDCDILDTELALSSTLIINQYSDCLVGDLTGFIDPSSSTIISPTGGTGPSYSIPTAFVGTWQPVSNTQSSSQVYSFQDVKWVDTFRALSVGFAQSTTTLNSYTTYYKPVIYTSNDGGSSFSPISIESPSVYATGGGLYSLDKVTGSTGSLVTVGYYNDYVAKTPRPIVWKSDDNGSNNSWVKMTTPNIIGTLNSVNFISSNLGYAVGVDTFVKGLILKTSDGGLNWTRYTNTWTAADNAELRSVSGTGSLAFAVGFDNTSTGVIYQTNDSGSTWTKYSSGWTESNVEIFNTVKVFDSNIAYAAGRDNNFGVVYKTTNGGGTWSKVGDFTYNQNLPSEANTSIKEIFDLYLVSATDLFIVGRDHQSAAILRSQDGGLTWTKYSESWTSVDNFNFTAVDINTNGVSLAIGDRISGTTRGTIFRYLE